ncbi:ferrous iron transport protein B, partial [Candidatus Poribacteria bacterium]|nr:ferrous iron transport protein B [Candidatus Poribacteria bacterium]
AWIRKTLEGVVTRPEEHRATRSDKLDAVLIHKVWGTLIFAAMMMVVFQAIYSWSAPVMNLIEAAFGAMGGVVEGAMADGPLRSFLVDGVIGGVGGVVIFLPQILVLFLFIAVLEDCGYMARAAFLMDKLLSRCGLSGRSFIPMLSSFACAIPGIMATRTIEDRRDRITTILVAPLMSCSARLPVYALLIGAFVPAKPVIPGLLTLQGIVLFGMYALGLCVAIPVALILKRTLLKGRTPSFIMELPPYKMPQWRTVLHRMIERGGAFLRRAGTIIFAVAIIVWAATYYPRPASVAEGVEAEFAAKFSALEPTDAAGRQALEAERSNALDGAYLRQSFLGRMGRFIEPAVEPLGWDWKIGMAALASFPAREVIIATLGVIYDIGGAADEESADLRSKLQNAAYSDGRPVFTVAVALSIMVFFALCAQCAATLAIIKRETNSWRWPVFTFAYMTGLAYVGAMLTYQVASRLIG